MTQPPDDAALVARHDDLAKQLFWADVMLGEHSENILPEWRDRWWDTSADMPLSGPGFLLKWRTLAAVAATALEAKDRRIAEADGILMRAADAIFELAMDAGNLVVAADGMADLRKPREDVLASLKRARDAHGDIVDALTRAALEPSDKGVDHVHPE